jgi:hypothetical protein
MWRRLWWGLLGRLAPRARDALVSQAGMCPHSCDRELWHSAFHAVRKSVFLVRDPRVAALAGLQLQLAADDPVRREAAAYARGLNAAFEQVRGAGQKRVGIPAA